MEKPTLIIVSGLRRSGTSLMMQILNAAGKKPNTDKVKKADKFNPKGYFEHSQMKTLLVDDSFLEEGVNKCTKIYASKLKLLPKKFNYKIIFMERDINEVYISIKNVNNVNLNVYTAPHLNFLQSVVEKAKDLISRSDNMEMISVNYNSLVNNPKEKLLPIINFLSVDKSSLPTMAETIDVNLYTANNQNEILTIDRSPAAIVPFIEEHVKGKIYCEIGIGEGDNLAEVMGAKKTFGVEVLKYGVERCKQKFPQLEIIHASILDVLNDIDFEVCFMWLVYPLNREVVLEIIKKIPNAKILMGINYYYHLNESDEKYKKYIGLYRDVALAETWNQNTRDLIAEVDKLGYDCEIAEVTADSKEKFSVGIIQKK